MRRVNTFNEVASTGFARIDAGDGITLDLPVDLATRLAALEYDTGWRIIPAFEGVTGTIMVKRSAAGAGDRTSIRLVGVLPPPGEGSAFLVSLPAGFRHTGEHWFIADGRGVEMWSEIGLYNGSRAAWVMAADGSPTRPTDPFSAEYTWESPDDRPWTIPGEPA